MISKQELVELIAKATSEDMTSYKSMQELLLIIASCIDIDEETGEVSMRVKSVE